MSTTEQCPPPFIVRTRNEAGELLEELLRHEFVAVDSEWIDYDKGRTPVNNGLSICWTFCWRDGDELKTAFLYNFGESEGLIHVLERYWTSKEHYKILHNAPVDWHILHNHGIVGQAFRIDTMVMDYLVDENRENRHGLKECAFDHLGHDRLDYNETFGTPMLRLDGEPYANGRLFVPSLREVIESEGGFDTLVDYATDDAYDTYMLFEIFRKKLRETPWKKNSSYWDYFWHVESRITEIIMRVERRGMYLDIDFLREKLSDAEQDMESIEAAIIEQLGIPFNIGSNKQKVMLFHGKGNQPIMRGKKTLFTIEGLNIPPMDTTPTGGPSVGAPSLRKMQKWIRKNRPDDEDTAQLINWIIEYSNSSKQKSTYLVGLPEKAVGDRIHTRINQVGTTSGRFSSASPNLQNITTGDKDKYFLRDAFCAPPGCLLIVADFGQLEYRLLAHFSQDPALIKAFTDDLDLHSLTTYNVFPDVQREVIERFGKVVNAECLHWIAEEFPDERKKAKTLNFEIIYGVGPTKLGEQLRISRDAAWDMIQGWFRGYPYVKAWMNRSLAKARECGFGKTLIGRLRRPVVWKLSHKDNGVRGAEERTFINALIQGSAADVCERAMMLLEEDELLGELGYQLTMQVHDELVGEIKIENARPAADRVKLLMENPFTKPLRVPLPASVGIGPTWGTAKV